VPATAIELLGRGLEVVDCREVEQVIDLARQPPQVRFRHAEVRFREAAGDRHGTARPCAPELAQRLELRHGLRPHQDEDAVAAREQALDEVAADEPGSAGDEVRHLGIPDRLLSFTLIP
jgi:hypothetical protein